MNDHFYFKFYSHERHDGIALNDTADKEDGYKYALDDCGSAESYSVAVGDGFSAVSANISA